MRAIRFKKIDENEINLGLFSSFNRYQGVNKCWRKESGAKKLYISAHSSEETQAFYKALGCVEAKEYNSKLVAEEPCDCQLEYSLFDNQ